MVDFGDSDGAGEKLVGFTEVLKGTVVNAENSSYEMRGVVVFKAGS